MNTRHVLVFLLLGASCAGSVRAAPAGEPDPTFDGDGRRSIAFDLGASVNGSTADHAFAMARAPGGRTYFAGPVATASGIPVIGVARLRHDGSADPSFGVDGRVTLDEPLVLARVLDAAVDGAGRLVLVGTGSDALDTPNRAFACRMLPGGDLDKSFGSPATPGCRLAALGTANALTLLPDGDIVLAGANPYSEAHVIRINEDGSMDFDFGDMGVATLGTTTLLFEDIAVLPDGDLLAAGRQTWQNPPQDDQLIARFGPTGELIDSFGKNGLFVLPVNIGPPGAIDDHAGALLVLGDGSVLVAGAAQSNTMEQRVPTLHRFRPDGTLDTDFGTGGLLVYDPCAALNDGCDLEPNDMLEMPDGRILLAGGLRTAAFRRYFALMLRENGEPDEGFGEALLPGQEGFVMPSFALVPDQPEATAYRVLAQGGRVLLGGDVEVPQVGINPTANFDFGAMRLDHGIADSFLVTPAAGPGGRLTPDTAQEVAHSDVTEFDVTPDPGFVLATIEGCGGALYGNVYTTDPVTTHCTVTATFETEDGDTLFTVTTEAGSHGSLSPPGPHHILEGQVLALTATADAGFLAQVSGCGGSLDGDTYTTAPITADCTIVAAFVPIDGHIFGDGFED